MEQIGPLIPDISYYVHRKCGADWVIIDSVIDFHDLTYITAGQGTYKIDGREHSVSSGSLVYIPPDSRRQAWTSTDDPIEVFAINFYTEHRLPFDTISMLGKDPKLTALFMQLTRVWMEREEMYTMDAGAVAVQIFCELYRRLCRNKPVNQFDERIEKVKDYINGNYHKRLSLAVLARQVDLNPVYLGALFAQKEACGVREYINKVRVQNAYEIMRTEKLSINDVALDCGFTDAFYFSRVFKKYIGISPSKIEGRA